MNLQYSNSSVLFEQSKSIRFTKERGKHRFECVAYVVFIQVEGIHMNDFRANIGCPKENHNSISSAWNGRFYLL